MADIKGMSQPGAKKIKLGGNEKSSDDTSRKASSDEVAGSAETKSLKQTDDMVGAKGDGTCDKDAFDFKFSTELSLERIRQLQSKFAKERNWDQYHSPRNILLAMVGEVGETAELFQWKSETKVGLPDWKDKERSDLGDELSDVLIYLVRLAHVSHVDLPTAVLRKFEKNAVKYPASKVHGSSKKYTEYKD